MHIRENSRHREMFDELGYKTKTIVPQYYENGDNAIFMTKDLI
jgi:hypothetical protein